MNDEPINAEGTMWRQPAPDKFDLERRLETGEFNPGDAVYVEEPAGVATILEGGRYKFDEEPQTDTEQKLRDLAEFFEDRAQHHRQQSRVWLGLLVLAILGLLSLLLIPDAWFALVLEWSAN